MDFKNLWDSIPYPGFVLNKKFKILSANSFFEHYCGTSLPFIVGKKLNLFIAEDSSIFDILSKNEYVVCEKTDGVRYMMMALYYGDQKVCLFINRALEMFKVSLKSSN